MNEKTTNVMRMVVAHFEDKQILTTDEEAILNAAKDAFAERVVDEQRRECRIMRHIYYAAGRVVDAIDNDCKDVAHQSDTGRSAVINQGIHPADEYFTTEFLALVSNLEGAIRNYETEI